MLDARPADRLPTGILTGDPASLALSQGGGGVAGGLDSAAAGAMGFYAAVKLAAKQPLDAHYKRTSGIGNEYFMFGAPGQHGVRGLRRRRRHQGAEGRALPDRPGPGADRASAPAAAIAQMKQDLTRAETTGTQVLEVKQGTQVLQAAPASFAPTGPSSARRPPGTT